jgi:DNA-binding NtrC family response regulator
MATAEAPMAPITQIEGANLLNLIIVDDERAIREACREIASSLGFKVFVAESAEHAYRVMESHGADVVLLDWRRGAAPDEEPSTRRRRRGGDWTWHR